MVVARAATGLLVPKRRRRRQRLCGFRGDREVCDDDADNDQNQENVYSKRALKRWKKELQQKMDEFYSLDYEDFVDGLPTRFQYKEVAPSNYGLTTREILSLDYKDLNQIVSLKKIADSNCKTDVSEQQVRQIETANSEKVMQSRPCRNCLASVY